MKFKSTFIFAIVAAAVGVFTYLDYKNGLKQEAKEAEQEALLPEWSETGVSEFRIVNDGTDVHLKKENGQWTILAPIKDEAVNSNIDTLIRNMISDKVNHVEVEGSVNWSKYGLEVAKKFVELINEQSEKKVIRVSDKKTFDGKTYLRLNDGAQLLVASASWGSWVSKSVQELRDKKLLKNPGQIERITFEKPNGLTFVVEGEGWKLETDKSFKVDSSKLKNIINAVKNMTGSAVVAEEQTRENLKKYNLLKPDNTVILEFSDPKDTAVIKVSKNGKGDGDFFVSSNLKPFIYKASKPIVEKWKLTKSDVEYIEPKKPEMKAPEAEKLEPKKSVPKSQPSAQ